jgi:hypothetical protein
MRLSIRVPLAGLALVGSLVLAAPSAGAVAHSAEASASAARTSARNAAGWLGRQFEPNGDLPETQGEMGIDYLPLALVALASARVGSTQLREGIGYLERHFESYVRLPTSKTTSLDDPGRLAQVILAALVGQANPRAFGGTGPSSNLVARLLATEVKTGSNAGLFGSPASPTYSSAYTQGLVLVALAAAGAPNAGGALWLVHQQCADGGWEPYRASPSTACAPPDPATYSGPDTNSAALAVEGLIATGRAPAHKPLPFFEKSQYASGGFGYYGVVSPAQVPDPDSTAVVIQALVALRDLGAVRRDGHGAEAGLNAFVIGCGAAAGQRGAFRYPGTSGPSLYATIQAIPAAAGYAFPLRRGSTSSSLPVMSCGRS